jgi:hypothetical protein
MPRPGHRGERSSLPGLEWLTVGRQRAVGSVRSAPWAASRATRSASTSSTRREASTQTCSGVAPSCSETHTSTARGEVLGQLDPHRLLGDDAGASHQLLNLAAHASTKPRSIHTAA